MTKPTEQELEALINDVKKWLSPTAAQNDLITQLAQAELDRRSTEGKTADYYQFARDFFKDTIDPFSGHPELARLADAVKTFTRASDGKLVECGCGDGYPENSYGAGWIDATGRCPNCEASEGKVDVEAWTIFNQRYAQSCPPNELVVKIDDLLPFLSSLLSKQAPDEPKGLIAEKLQMLLEDFGPVRNDPEAAHIVKLAIAALSKQVPDGLVDNFLNGYSSENSFSDRDSLRAALICFVRDICRVN